GIGGSSTVDHRRQHIARSYSARRSGNKTVALAGSRSCTDRQACKRSDLSPRRRGGVARGKTTKREPIQDRTGQALPDACPAHGGGKLIFRSNHFQEQPMATQQPVEPRTGAPIEPRTGAPFEPRTGAPIEPATSPIGRDTPRIDGPRKVTGLAQYTSDFSFPGMLYAVPVEATIASGKLLALDTTAAEKMPGVRAVF